MKGKVIDKDRGWQAILAAARDAAKGASVRVGILGDNERGGLHVVDEETGKSSPLTVAEIAVVNEYGTEDGRIPARPAHRMAFDANRDDLQALSFKLLVAVVIERRLSYEQALGLLGAKHAANIKATITEGAEVPPTNALSTLAAKEASGAWNRKGKAQAGEHPAGPRTLVDTGRTVNAISWAVEIGAETKPAKYLGGGD